MTPGFARFPCVEQSADTNVVAEPDGGYIAAGYVAEADAMPVDIEITRGRQRVISPRKRRRHLVCQRRSPGYAGMGPAVRTSDTGGWSG
jgi:hypothetical protein